MLRAIVDLFAVLIQSYITAVLFGKVFVVREPYRRSFFLMYMQCICSYFLVNYLFNDTPAERIICGTIVYIVFGFFYFEGRRLTKVKNAILEYILMLSIDMSLQFTLFPVFNKVILSLPPLDQKLLGRNVGTAALFLIVAILEMFATRKESKQKLGVAILAVAFAGVQLVIFNLLASSNPEDMLERRFLLTAIFTMVMMGGYLIVDELFKQTLRQQQKQAELEQMALESKYQYDYYQKALAQGERIRDIRHDMRNQLQTVEYLLCSEAEEDRRRAEEMVEMLSEKAGGVC